MLRVLACAVLVSSTLLSTTKISRLRVIGGTVFFSGFRDSIDFIVLVVLDRLTNLTVPLRGRIFQVTPGTNMSRFSTEVADNILSRFLCKTFFEDFNPVQDDCGLGLTFFNHSVSHRTCGCSRNILLPIWSLEID